MSLAKTFRDHTFLHSEVPGEKQTNGWDQFKWNRRKRMSAEKESRREKKRRGARRVISSLRDSKIHRGMMKMRMTLIRHDKFQKTVSEHIKGFGAEERNSLGLSIRHKFMTGARLTVKTWLLK